MRTVTFLSAQKSLTKSFFADGRKEPYPLVKDFKSSVLGYETIQELKEAMELVGDSGGCMLKGHLSREIDFESRVGLTDANALTDLLVIDYDSDGGFESIPDLLAEIDPVLPDTDYIFQHSASSGITGKAGIRGHIFIQLLSPISPNVLKQYFKKINLLNERFKKRIKLSRNFMSLCYALDITINQNDKLVYIAPPILGPGLNDPIEQRFMLHVGMHKYFDCQPSVSLEANRIEEHKVIAAMREKVAMPQRAPKYKLSGETEMLLNPGICNVSSVLACGKYTRINLSGGDSWAYYYLNDNPDILYNFKGEPAVYLKDIAPEYFAQIQQVMVQTEARPFVFRDLASNVYYNAECDNTTNELLRCHVSSRPALNDFMLVRGQPMARNEAIHDWTMMFDPTAQTPVNFGTKTVNIYRPSKYMLANPKVGYFPCVEKVLRHICVEDETYEHFLKWMAHIVQFRTKTQTAWIFQGCEGCLSGDTMIGLTRGRRNEVADRPRTIKNIYESWSGTGEHRGKGYRPFDHSIGSTRVMSCKDDLSIGLHEVFDIYESGVKPLWELTTNTGRSIKATKEHPFMRTDKSFTPMEALSIGDEILVQGDRLVDRAGLGRNKNRATVHSIPHHPNAWKHIIDGKNYKRSHKARLVYEAELNGLSYETFLVILRTKPEIAETLVYLTKDEVIHHIDEDPSNDVLSNLACIDKFNHDQHHAESTGLGTHPAIVETVVCVRYVGEEMTYDMTMKAPYHNYVANGFVVSNTGKGTLFHKILAPIVGEEQSFIIGQDQTEDQFNSYMRSNMLLFLDEGDIESSKQADKMLARFRTLITDPTVPVRQMRASTVNMPNFTNLIIATNQMLPIRLTDGDRRYNVAPRQNQKLIISDAEYASIEGELMAFVGHLKTLKISDAGALQVLKSDARADLMELSKTVADTFIAALMVGDLDYMAEGLRDVMPMNDALYVEYAKVITNWMNTAGEEINIDTRDLLTVYQYISGNREMTAKKFGYLGARHNLKTRPCRQNGVLRRGYDVTFEDRGYSAWLNRNPKLNVVPMKKLV